MATVTRENMGVLHDKLIVTVGKDEYMPKFETSLKKYSKNANIPGFRKGMVPAGLVKKMYGAGIFNEEVIRTAEDSLYKFLQEEKLDIFAQPLPLEFDNKQLDMNNPSDCSFSFEIGLKPEMNIDVTKHSVTKYVIDVEDKMVEEEVERLRRRFGKMSQPETVSNEEDMLNITFEESDKEGNIVEGGANKQDSVLLKYFKESFRKKLVGKKVEDSIVMQPGKAFEDKELEFVAKDLGLDKENKDDLAKYFKATITKIGFVEMAEMNEELFVQAFPNAELKSEGDFRNYIKQDIGKAFAIHARNQTNDEIYHALIDNTAMELPEQFLKRWLQTSGENPKTEEEVEKEFPSFKNSLKWTVISNKISTDNNIKVENDDIKELAKAQLFQYMGMGIDGDSQPWVDDYVNRMMKDKKFVEDSYYRVQSEKMFAVLESQVKLNEKAISFEEFGKIQHHHAH